MRRSHWGVLRATSALPAVVVGVLALLSAVPAHAAVRSARFWATVSGTQEIKWSEREHSMDSDCFHLRTRRGQGQETVKLTTKRTQAYVQAANGKLVMTLGTWGPWTFGFAKGQLTIDRKGGYTTKETPGSCGGAPTKETTPRYDCRKISNTKSVSLGVEQFGQIQRAVLTIGPYPLSKTSRYDTCPVVTPPHFSPASFGPSLSGRLSVNTFFNKRVSRIVLRGSFTSDDTPNRYTTTHGTEEWKATLTRVK